MKKFTPINLRTFFLLFAVLLFITSCSKEERDRLPRIDPGDINLSVENPEAYFQVYPRDYDMFSFSFFDGKEYRITKAYKKMT